MTRARFTRTVALALALSLSAAVAARADVKTEEKSLVKFEGMLGKVMGFFGGKAAKEGVVTTVALKDNRRARYSENQGEIVDLNEEKVYYVDLKAKSYRALTFEQLRQQMEAAMKKAEAEMKEQRAKEEKPEGSQPPAKEFEMDFSVQETGQRKTISGFDCREVISTLTLREKGKTLEQGGGLVMTADSWMAPKVPAITELMEFEMAYAKKLMGPAGMAQAEQMATALAMYPGLKDAMVKFQAESAKLDGTPIQTVTKIESVKSAEQMAQAQQQPAKAEEEKETAPTSLGGLGGMFGKKLMKKKAEEPADKAASNRATFMTTTTEYLRIGTEVAAADVSVPAGFRDRSQ